MLKEGTKAPEFTLNNAEGKSISLADFKGSWVLLYFYPKDNTPGCTAEACNFRDNNHLYAENNIKVLGVSPDDQKSHSKFASKFALPFDILSDTEKEVSTKYGVWQEKSFMGKKYMGVSRSSFLIDPDGVVRKVYSKVNPLTHSNQVIVDFKSLV